MNELARGLVADFGAILGLALLVFGLHRELGLGWACVVMGVLLIAFSALLLVLAAPKGGG